MSARVRSAQRGAAGRSVSTNGVAGVRFYLDAEYPGPDPFGEDGVGGANRPEEPLYCNTCAIWRAGGRQEQGRSSYLGNDDRPSSERVGTGLRESPRAPAAVRTNTPVLILPNPRN